jgi:hypothetical protein
MRGPACALLAVLLVCLGGACGAPETEVRADLCADLGHLEGTILALVSPDPETRIGVVRGNLERLDPTFGNVSRSELATPSALERLLQAHVDYRDQFRAIGDDDRYEILGPVAPAAGRELQLAFVAVQADLGCPDREVA